MSYYLLQLRAPYLLRSVNVHSVVGSVSHQVGIAYVMLYNTTPQDDRSSSLRKHSHAVNPANVLHNIDNKTRILERVQVQHVTDRAVC